jgi:hypothetical protein
MRWRNSVAGPQGEKIPPDGFPALQGWAIHRLLHVIGRSAACLVKKQPLGFVCRSVTVISSAAARARNLPLSSRARTSRRFSSRLLITTMPIEMTASTLPKGAETDISTLLGADILALLLQRSFANRMLWNVGSPKCLLCRLADVQSQSQHVGKVPTRDSCTAAKGLAIQSPRRLVARYRTLLHASKDVLWMGAPTLFSQAWDDYKRRRE